MPVIFDINIFTIWTNNLPQFSMKWEDVPLAVEAHLQECPTTPEIEQQGSNYSGAGFPNETIFAFVDAVCKWGGRYGAAKAAGVKKFNQKSAANVANFLRQAFTAKSPEGALQEVTCIKGLAISFGSKHLRMLKPDEYVVLDKVLSENLKYDLKKRGYALICADCTAIADELARRGIENPMATKVPRGGSSAWFPADVEMALFAECMGWSNYGQFRPTGDASIRDLKQASTRLAQGGERVDGAHRLQIKLEHVESYTKILKSDRAKNLGYIVKRTRKTWVTIYRDLNDLLPVDVDVTRIPGFELRYKAGGSAPLTGSIPFSDFHAAIQWLKCYFDVEG